MSLGAVITTAEAQGDSVDTMKESRRYGAAGMLAGLSHFPLHRSLHHQSYETERSPVWRGSFGVAPQIAAWKEEERKLRCGSTSSRRHLSPLHLPVIKFFSASLCHEPRRWVARRGSGRELEDRGGTTSWCGGGGASRLWSMDSEDKALGSSRLSYQPGMGKAEKERRQGRELRGTGEHSGSGLEK